MPSQNNTYMSLHCKPKELQRSPSMEDPGVMALRYRSTSDSKHAFQRPSGNAPHAFKTPIATFHNRSQLINNLFYRKALSRVHKSIRPEQQALMKFFNVGTLDMMHARMARFLEDQGEEGEHEASPCHWSNCYYHAPLQPSFSSSG